VKELDDDLKATAESVIDDARRLEAVETAKSDLDPDDGRVTALATEARTIARRILLKTEIEHELAAETATDAPGPAPEPHGATG
jgi:hypothetical protein